MLSNYGKFTQFPRAGRTRSEDLLEGCLGVAIFPCITVRRHGRTEIRLPVDARCVSRQSVLPADNILNHSGGDRRSECTFPWAVFARGRQRVFVTSSIFRDSLRSAEKGPWRGGEPILHTNVPFGVNGAQRPPRNAGKNYCNFRWSTLLQKVIDVSFSSLFGVLGKRLFFRGKGSSFSRDAARGRQT